MIAIKPQDDGNVILFQQEEYARAVQLLSEENLTFGKVYRSHKGEAQEFLMLDELKWLSSEGGIDMSSQHVAFMTDDGVPVPAMLLAQHSGCNVTVIDPVPETASLAGLRKGRPIGAVRWNWRRGWGGASFCGWGCSPISA